MPAPEKKFVPTEAQDAAITKWFMEKFTRYKAWRDDIDVEIREEIDLYNNIDKKQDTYEEWEAKVKMPYAYAVTQTAVARVAKSIFGRDNWVKAYTETTNYNREAEKALSQFIQDEMEIIKLSSRARDFIEESATKRTSWLHLRPRKGERKAGEGMWTIDFDTLDWYDVWFDPMARTPDETDFFVRKPKRMSSILRNDKVYFNFDKLRTSAITDTDNQERDFKSKNSGERTIQYEFDATSPDRQVELIEYWGEYDFSEDPSTTDFKEVIFTIANRSVLVRTDYNEMPTRRKRMFFPIRIFRQANSLIGKSIIQLIRDDAVNLNEVLSLQLQNARLLAKLMFKYRKNADIDHKQMYGAGGNAIPFVDDPSDIQMFEIPNVIGHMSNMAQQYMLSIQNTTGALDYVMGTSVSRGASETATTTRLMTDQALFKFGMMVDNIKDDLIDFITYAMIVKLIYDKEGVLIQYPDMKVFADMPATLLEENRYFDIAITDLSQRRDTERSQFINATNIIGNLLKDTGGNVQAFLAEAMDKLQMEGTVEILTPNEEMNQALELTKAMAQNPMLGQIMSTLVQSPALAQKIGAMMQGALPAPADGAGGEQGGAVVPTQETLESMAAQVNV